MTPRHRTPSHASTLHDPCLLQVCLLLSLFPLHFVHKVKVALVEVVYTNVTILSTTAVSGALGVNCDVVERTEVASDTANLLAEDLVVETSFELSLTGAGRGDIHGCLSTTENYVVLDGGDGGAVERRVGDVCLEHLEAVGSRDLNL